MNRPNQTTRRQFLKRGLAGSAGVSWTFAAGAPLTSIAAAKPNSRITLGFIGLGKRGRSLLHRFLNDDEVRVLAVSDVSTARREDAVRRVNKAYGASKKSGRDQGCAGYNDFRDLLARKDLDAVVIGTPDHWHAIPAIQAARAGMHVYCEKPLSHTVHEGRAMVDAAREHGIVFQTGSQQRTGYGGKFRRAAEYVRSGRLGEIKRIRVGVGSSPVPYHLASQPMPDGLDWDMWIGPGPMVAYTEKLCPKGIHNHFPNWRDYQEFGGGGLADMGAHHFDIAQWALGMDDSGPVEIVPPKDDSSQGLKFVYANGIEMFHGGPSGTSFEGTEGSLHVDRGVIESDPKSVIEEPLGSDEVQLENPEGDHQQNWINAIRAGRKPIADVEIGHRSATICHLANIGYRYRRNLHWDPQKERFRHDTWANDDLKHPKRGEWAL